LFSNYFDPHKSFLDLKIVRYTISVLTILSIISAYVITIYSDIDLDPRYQGFNNFVNFFQVPLGLLALIIPIVALLASNHRSVQTKEQIRLALAQNNFSNYYKHIEEFEKFCRKIQEDDENTSSATIKKPRNFYGIVFSGAPEGDYFVSTLFLEQFDDFIKQFIELSEGLNSLEHSNLAETTVRMIEHINDFCNQLNINIGQEYAEFYLSNMLGHSLNLKKVIILLDTVCKVVRDALFFDVSYNPSNWVSSIINLDYEKIPENDLFIKNDDAMSEYRPFSFKQILAFDPVDKQL
jgi:hypothetical protein